MIAPPRLIVLLCATAASFVSQGGGQSAIVHGRVVDAVSRAAIAGAIVTAGTRELRSNPQGFFAIDRVDTEVVGVRAARYLAATVPARPLRAPDATVSLTPFRAKALYLTVYSIGSRTLRTAALDLLETTELNALVIDVKGDRGLVPYRSAIPLAARVGAQRVITIPDLPGLIRDLRERGIYTIARIVVFKDDLLASSRPELAVRRRDGSIYRDRERLAWVNPYSREVWHYDIGVAVEAAKAGFDEVQFDYVRLPDTTGLVYDLPWTEQNREAAIDGFLTEARKALTPFNVFLSADTFGYICWNSDDTRIGQRLEHLAGIVDYISPMLYPSGFHLGIPGYRSPVQHPYEIVRLSLDRARDRTQLSPLHFRPWLQAFRDYAFGGRPFTAGEVRSQIKASEDFGAGGWMIWNPRNRYSATDFISSPTPGPTHPRGRSRPQAFAAGISPPTAWQGSHRR